MNPRNLGPTLLLVVVVTGCSESPEDKYIRLAKEYGDKYVRLIEEQTQLESELRDLSNRMIAEAKKYLISEGYAFRMDDLDNDEFAPLKDLDSGKSEIKQERDRLRARQTEAKARHNEIIIQLEALEKT